MKETENRSTVFKKRNPLDALEIYVIGVSIFSMLWAVGAIAFELAH